jgi:UDP-N-acetyl-2-amino-2-deoxyglucuronate dehydrogenase
MYQHVQSRSNDSTVRFSFVGCGRIAVKYLTFFARTLPSDACLVAVCDPDIERASALVRGLDVRVFAHPLDMMEQMGNSIDVIAILAPSGLHAEITVNLAKYGKIILVEKPMALTLVDADRMIDVCDSSATKLFVVKQNRLNLPIRRLIQAIESGRFGKLFMATSRIRWCRKQEYYDESPWSGRVNGDGGIFANQASHYLDLLQWMCGDVASVVAKTSKALLKIETEDTGVALLQFKNGALGVVEATTATRPTDLEGSISILGENGSVEISGYALNEVRTWSFVNPEPQDAEMQDYQGSKAAATNTIGHHEYLKHFIQCIRSNSVELVDGREGRKSLSLITAIYKSSFTGKEVFLP